MHWSPSDIKAITGFADVDGSGEINYDEFASSLQERDTVLTEGEDRGYVRRRTMKKIDDASLERFSLNRKQYGALQRFMTKLENRHGQGNWRGVFRAFDKDSDGSISREEFEQGVRSVGYDPTLPEVAVVADLASSSSAEEGEIDFAAFCKVMQKVQRKVYKATGLHGHSMYDTQKANRRIEKSKATALQLLMRRLERKFGRDKVLASFSKFDRGGAGEIGGDDIRFALFDLGDNPYSTLADTVISERRRSRGTLDYKRAVAAAVRHADSKRHTAADLSARQMRLVPHHIHKSTDEGIRLRKRNNDLGSRLRNQRINDLLARCGGVNKAFRKFDMDKDGVVDRAEFALGLASIGFDPMSGEIQVCPSLFLSMDSFPGAVVQLFSLSHSLTHTTFSLIL